MGSGFLILVEPKVEDDLKHCPFRIVFLSPRFGFRLIPFIFRIRDVNLLP